MNGTVMCVKMEKNYTLRGKSNHLKTKKTEHQNNYFQSISLIQL